MRQRAIGWTLAGGVTALVALGAGGCSSSSGAAQSGPGDDAGGQDGTGGGTACTSDSDCAAQVPTTTPANCAQGTCNAVQGVCTFSAKDEDGDGHASATCKSTNGVAVQAGDDCNDMDANLYPGHPESCATLPDGGTATTGLCKSGQITCQADGTPSACEQTLVCSDQACMGGACVGTCTPSATQCSTDHSGVETCSTSGAWGASAACTNQTCVGGACTGVCSPTRTQCSGQQPQSCASDGTWQSNGPACVHQTCVSGSCTGICAPGDVNCAGQQPQVCGADGTWTNNGAACGASNTCLSGACGGTCGPTDTRCSGQQPQSCNGGAWANNGAACDASHTCVSGACAGVCGPNQQEPGGCGECGSASCNTSGQWGTCTGQGACAPGATESCTPAYTAGGCSNGTRPCSGACQWETNVCTATPQSFPVNGSTGYGVDPTAFSAKASGPNCFGSTNNYGPWQVCPAGSVISSIACNMNTGPNGVDGHCTVIDQGSNTAGIAITANSNCAVGASGQLAVSCIAANCSVAP